MNKTTNEIPFYRLEPSTQTPDVGHWPQVVRLQGETKVDVDAFSRLLGVDPLPQQLPRADGFVLHARAKLTDLLSNRFVPEHIGLCVSERLKSLLEAHDLQNVRSCEMTFASKRQPGRYFILYFDRAFGIMDFERTTYIETDILLHPVGPEHRFATGEELTEAALTIVTTTENDIAPHRIVLNRVPDLLRLPHDPHGLHISARLQGAIKGSAMSGISITESDVQFIASDSEQANTS